MKELIETEIIDITTTEEVQEEKWSPLYNSQQALKILTSLEKTCNCIQALHTCLSRDNNKKDNNNNNNNDNNSNNYSNNNNDYSNNKNNKKQSKNNDDNISNNININKNNNGSRINKCSNNNNNGNNNNNNNNNIQKDNASSIKDNDISLLQTRHESECSTRENFRKEISSKTMTTSIEKLNQDNMRKAMRSFKESNRFQERQETEETCEESFNEVIRQLLVIGRPSPVPPHIPRKHHRVESKSLRWKKRNSKRVGGKISGRTDDSCSILGCPFCKSYTRKTIANESEHSNSENVIRTIERKDSKVGYTFSPLQQKPYFTVRSSFRNFHLEDNDNHKNYDNDANYDNYDDHMIKARFSAQHHHGNDDSEDSGVSVSDEPNDVNGRNDDTVVVNNNNNNNNNNDNDQKFRRHPDSTHSEKNLVIQQERKLAEDVRGQMSNDKETTRIFIDGTKQSIFIVGPNTSILDDRTKLTESGFFEDLDSSSSSVAAHQDCVVQPDHVRSANQSRRVSFKLTSSGPVHVDAHVGDVLSNEPFRLKIK